MSKKKISIEDEYKELYNKILDGQDWEIDDLDRLIEISESESYNEAIDDVNGILEKYGEEVYIGVVKDVLKLKKQ